MLHNYLQTFMLIVNLLFEMFSSYRDRSWYMLVSNSPKVMEKGQWARLSGCLTVLSATNQAFSILISGFLRSISAKIVPLRIQSMVLPSSVMTTISICNFQTYRSDKIHSDSGSRAFDPIITVSKSLVISLDSLRFYQKLFWQLWQSTLKYTMPQLGLSGFGAVISFLILIKTSVFPMLNNR